MLAVNDDYEDKAAALLTHQADSRLRLTLPATGTYYLHLGDTQHKGGPEYAYRLRVGPPRPDFELRVVPSSINARAGTSAPITVHALRRDGFAGDIALELEGPARRVCVGRRACCRRASGQGAAYADRAAGSARENVSACRSQGRA